MMIFANSKFYYWIKLLRVYQWSKNLLIFLPLIATKQFQYGILIDTFLLFMIFSLFLSNTYIINDIIDIKDDQKHPRKKYRPIAIGKISKKSAKIFCLVSFAFLTPLIFFNYSVNITLYFTLYILLSIFYSKIIKKIIFIDLVFLVLFFLLRIYLGGEFNNIEISYWLAGFSFFLFLSLATLKRSTELNNYNHARKYEKKHFKFLVTIGITSSIISMIILIFYIRSDNFQNYHNENYLFYLLPIILITWLLRANYLSFKKKLIDDPILFLLKDKLSYLFFLITLIIINS